MSIAVYFFSGKMAFFFHTNHFAVMVEALVPCGGFIWMLRERKKNLSQLNAIDNTETGRCENGKGNPHPRSFMVGIWSAMGKKHWRWICRAPPPISPASVLLRFK